MKVVWGGPFWQCRALANSSTAAHAGQSSCQLAHANGSGLSLLFLLLVRLMIEGLVRGARPEADNRGLVDKAPDRRQLDIA